MNVGCREQREIRMNRSTEPEPGELVREQCAHLRIRRTGTNAQRTDHTFVSLLLATV
jgi:hypothetical protein